MVVEVVGEGEVEVGEVGDSLPMPSDCPIVLCTMYMPVFLFWLKMKCSPLHLSRSVSECQLRRVVASPRLRPAALTDTLPSCWRGKQ